MNISNGFYRLAQVIKWTGWLWGSICLCLALYGVLFGNKSGNVSIAVITAVAGLIGWGISAALAWIFEGFANG
jgi:hypothetical protein